MLGICSLADRKHDGRRGDGDGMNVLVVTEKEVSDGAVRGFWNQNCQRPADVQRRRNKGN